MPEQAGLHPDDRTLEVAIAFRDGWREMTAAGRVFAARQSQVFRLATAWCIECALT